jgi:uncharacterized protein YodC (DUF2158 family)
MTALKPGDVVKQRGADGRPTGPAMAIACRSEAVTSHLCWECVWHWNGTTRRRAFLADNLLPVGKPAKGGDGSRGVA